MVFNVSFGEECQWQHVPVQVLPPACVHHDCPDAAVTLEIVGDFEDILRAAIRNATAMNAQQIKDLMAAYHIPAPLKGTGKNGGVKKIDRVTAMVQFLFPTDDDDTIQKLISGVMNQKVQQDMSDTPEFILKLTGAVDEREARHFDKVKQDAVDELQAREEMARSAKQHRDRDKEPGKQPTASGDRAAETAANDKAEEEPPRATGDEPAGPSSGVPRAAPAVVPGRAAHTKAPPEFLELLPSVPFLYFKWQPRHRRAMVDFARITTALCFNMRVEEILMLLS